MDEVVAILWLYEKLEEECDDGDDSRADDGDAVVDVVPWHLHGQVLDPPEPHQNIKAEACEPEEDTYHGELKQQTKYDTTAGLYEEMSEAADDDDNDKGKSKEEAKWNLESSAVVRSQLINDTMEDDVDENADNTDWHDHCLGSISRSRFYTCQGNLVNCINAVFVQCIFFVIYQHSWGSVSPKELGIFHKVSITFSFNVDVCYVFKNICQIFSTGRNTIVPFSNKIFSTAKINTRLSSRTSKAFSSNSLIIYICSASFWYSCPLGIFKTDFAGEVQFIIKLFFYKEDISFKCNDVIFKGMNIFLVTVSSTVEFFHFIFQ